jgi:hypothetical protein
MRTENKNKRNGAGCFCGSQVGHCGRHDTNGSPSLWPGCSHLKPWYRILNPNSIIFRIHQDYPQSCNDFIPTTQIDQDSIPKILHTCTAADNTHQNASHYKLKCLCVCVAELIADCAHHISNPESRRVDTEVNEVVQSGVGGWREIEDRVRAGDSILAGLQILVLPDPPRAINLSMVQEEVRVAGRSVKITARVTTDPEVAASVHTQIAGWEVALHPVLEAENIRAVRDELICEGQWSAKFTHFNTQVFTHTADCLS